MAAQHFHVVDLQAGVFDVADDFGQARNVATREDVFVDPGVKGAPLLAGNPVDQGDPVVNQVVGYVLEVETEVFGTDVFKHSHRGDVIPLAIA